MKMIIIIRFIQSIILFSCFAAYSQKEPKKHSNTLIAQIMADLKDDFSDYVVIWVADQSNNMYEMAIPAEQIGTYYFTVNHIPAEDYAKEEAAYLKYMEALLRSKKTLILDSLDIKYKYSEYLVDAPDYTELEKMPLEHVIKTYFGTDYKINRGLKGARLNSVIKRLYINEILLSQDDFSGHYMINSTPFVKSILDPKSIEK